MPQLEGKTALIAGAGRNNGKAIALAFAREGADLIMVAREKRDELEAVSKECQALGAKTLPLLADVSDHEQVNRMVQQGLDHFGKVDVMVNVAGRRPHQDFWDISYDEWLRVFAVNLHSMFYLAKALTPSMIRRGEGGSLIALGGLASLTSMPQRAHVTASKTGLYGLIKSLALELGPYNIRANLIALSLIDNVRVNPEWYPEKGAGTHTSREMEGCALQRTGRPEEVANVAVYLASDQSSYVTGDRVLCTGGKGM
ncbi:MAG: SDR family oxidoreductase [Betaproteobacteria bacterium]|nr:SDR family oxidoreductase [Betaproteobacteria bacterium]